MNHIDNAVLEIKRFTEFAAGIFQALTSMVGRLEASVVYVESGRNEFQIAQQRFLFEFLGTSVERIWNEDVRVHTSTKVIYGSEDQKSIEARVSAERHSYRCSRYCFLRVAERFLRGLPLEVTTTNPGVETSLSKFNSAVKRLALTDILISFSRILEPEQKQRFVDLYGSPKYDELILSYEEHLGIRVSEIAGLLKSLDDLILNLPFTDF